MILDFELKMRLKKLEYIIFLYLAIVFTHFGHEKSLGLKFWRAVGLKKSEISYFFDNLATLKSKFFIKNSA